MAYRKKPARPPPGPRPGVKCTVCRHPERARIEAVMAAGVSSNKAAERFGLHRDALLRHWKNHVSAHVRAALATRALQPGVQLEELAAQEGSGILEGLRALRLKMQHMLDAGVEVGDQHGVAAIAGRIMENYTLTAKLCGELLGPAHTTNILNVSLTENPRFLALQARLVEALAPFPEARRAVVAAFSALAEEPEPQSPGAAARLIEARAHHLDESGRTGT